MAKTSEAQLRASAKYNKKHKEASKINAMRSNAKRYLRECLASEEVEEFQELINNRKKELNIK